MTNRAVGGLSRGLERSERPPGKVFGLTEFGESDLNTQREGSCRYRWSLRSPHGK